MPGGSVWGGWVWGVRELDCDEEAAVGAGG